MNYNDVPRVLCLRCGDWIYKDEGDICKNCRRIRGIRWNKAKAAERRRNGIMPKSYKTRARKAYNTRLVNLSQTNPEDYEKRLKTLASKEPRRAGHIKGRVRKLAIAA